MSTKNLKGIIKSQISDNADTTVWPEKLFLIPLKERAFLPPQTLPILVSAELAETIQKIESYPAKLAGFILEHEEIPTNFYKTGTLFRMHHAVKIGDKIQFIAEGIRRFQIKRWISKKIPFSAEVVYPENTYFNEKKLEIYGTSIIKSLKELAPLSPFYNEEFKFFLERFSPQNPSSLADFSATLTGANKLELQEILEETSLNRRLEKVLVLIKKEVEMAKMQIQIRQTVEEKISDNQRNFFLKEQLKVIQKELGIAKDDKTADIEQFEDRLKNLRLSEEVKRKINEELDKLSILETGSPEYAVTRNYLDVITTLPWRHYSVENLSLRHARKILHQDHTGLNDIKTRIIEFIAVGILRGDTAGSILLFVGPPGVGKTSIGRSIARALNRKFYRFSVGGMRDEAEIKGHRRTYIGAMPGKIIQALKEVGAANPVIMLDEIDKIGSNYRGDPASALLEVLDSEQNQSFLDHYLDIRFDLSKVLFICTANQLDTIPRPLLDRMEIIHLAGYITEEKMAIAKKHLWPKQLTKSGLKKTQLKISDACLRQVIEGYAREAGVRTLEKKLGKIARKAAVKFINKPINEISLTLRNLTQYLEAPIFRDEKPLAGVGIVTGLAWTALGGVTLSIEANRISKKHSGYKLTGKLGEVMRESAEIAYSYVVSNVRQFGIDETFFDTALIHIHAPEGSVSKDGPSAGITMASALISLARNQQVPRLIAMTGELTLTGHVLAVGGIREKITAAKRAKLAEVILPKSVLSDYKELPSYIRKGLIIHPVEHFSQIFKILFK